MTEYCICGNEKAPGPSEVERIHARLRAIRIERVRLAEEEVALMDQLDLLAFGPSTENSEST